MKPLVVSPPEVDLPPIAGVDGPGPALVFRDDVRVDIDGETVILTGPGTALTLRPVRAGVRDALSRLAAGPVPVAELFDGLSPAERPKLGRVLDRAGAMLAHSVLSGRCELLRLEQTGRDTSHPIIDVAVDTPVRMSRFAFLRTRADTLVLESPLATFRVLLVHRATRELVAGLGTTRTPGELAGGELSLDEVLPVLRPDGGRAGLSFGLAIVAGLGIVGLIAGAYWLYDKSTRFEPQLTVNTPSVDMPPLEPVVVVPQAGVPVDATVPAAQPAGEVQVVPPPANLPGNPPAVPGANPALAVGATPAPLSPALPAPVPQPAPVAVPAAVPEPSTGDVRVVARQESWVQITDATGKRLVNELVPAGQSRSVVGKPPYRIRIGNGHQTQLFYKGKPTDLTPYIRVDVANLELN